MARKVDADCIIIQGSNFAEAHPVGFQRVMEAKERGAKIIHVDPRFSRTSAMADTFVPLRAGSDIAFLGGLISWVLGHDAYFHDYVVNYTNAATILSEDFKDTEELDGFFSGFDPENRAYNTESWQYKAGYAAPSSGERDSDFQGGSTAGGSSHAQSHGSGGASVQGEGDRDETLQDPRCVFQVLKRHYARYTPEMVEQVCGVPQDLFREVAETITANSGRERTTAFAYAVGWTQHTTGTQYIRTASVLQLLLGNIGHPGGGIMALRGHAGIQGSSDIPTLYDLLPGHLPSPHAEHHLDLDSFTVGGAVGLALGGRSSRVVSTLSGVAIAAGSALLRFGIFEAGRASTRDPKYVVVPQRERLEQQGRRPATVRGLPLGPIAWGKAHRRAPTPERPFPK